MEKPKEKPTAAEATESLSAHEYLGRRYGLDVFPDLPLADEPFVREWEIIKDVLSGEAVTSWLEKTPAGGIPVVYARSRASFGRAVNALSPGGDSADISPSVNAFTIKAKHPDLPGHRVIILNRSGYSALSEKELGMEEEEWLEKSMTLRLHHEICHYFSLRVLGGMRNHLLDEIAADCVGQLAAFGTFKAPLQKLFFGISQGGVLSGGRFFFYVKKLREDAVGAVLEETEAALSNLESYLSKNPDMVLEPNRPRLVTKLLTAGIPGIRALD